MDNKKGHPEAAPNKHPQFSDNSASSQRQRLMEWLKGIGSITTIEARSLLDIMAPAPRIFELRAIGYDIATVWTNGTTDQGKKHRVARYILRGVSHE